jgi:hypothetical protein
MGNAREKFTAVSLDDVRNDVCVGIHLPWSGPRGEA